MLTTGASSGGTASGATKKVPNEAFGTQKPEEADLISTEIPDNLIIAPSQPQKLGDENNVATEMTMFGPADAEFQFQLSKCHIYSYSTIKKNETEQEDKSKLSEVGPETTAVPSPLSGM